MNRAKPINAGILRIDDGCSLCWRCHVVDDEAALAHLNTGHLAGIGLDVFPTEPYPADGPLLAHPRILATAHTASLTSDYFAAASRRLGDALAGYLDHQPPAGLLR